MVDPSAPGRRSRLTADGATLLFGDLHNHSMLSDGRGDPAIAYAELRAAGLDFAALTDHASIPHDALHTVQPSDYPDLLGYRLAMAAPNSIDAASWSRTCELADAADVPGEFTAIRGFEWTEPWLGHANVWFTNSFLHVHTPGRIAGLHDWLGSVQPDALFGYNHPGREAGRFHDFAYAAGLAPRMVALEIFNRTDDYLFEGWATGRPSPIVACLDAGWRPGLVGVSDEHGTAYGLTGKGRTGLWAFEHSREGVRQALLTRRSYATREAGLRLDATLDGACMGGALPELAGTRELALDLDQDPPHRGRPVLIQVLTHGDGGTPELIAAVSTRIGEVLRVEISAPPDTSWLLVRVADPSREATPGPPGHPATAHALAYASPWFAPRDDWFGTGA